jgi:hypothetical protein
LSGNPLGNGRRISDVAGQIVIVLLFKKDWAEKTAYLAAGIDKVLKAIMLHLQSILLVQ